MSRIVYLVFGTDAPRGGHKMALRHVEALRYLGFDSVVWMPEGVSSPLWLEHHAVIQSGGHFRNNDILVFPEDALNAMRHFREYTQRKVVFCQNHVYAAAQGVGLLSATEAECYTEYMACSQTTANWLARFVRHQSIEVVPAFADERIFRPADKTLSIACSVTKRPAEFRAIQTMIPHLHRSKQPWRWAIIKNKSEVEVAKAMGEATIFISLSRLEGLGITTLEAMASGCLLVGFAGLGGREYTRPTNGFWSPDDDVEHCAYSLARAMALVENDHSVVRLMRESARATASEYSYSKFVESLGKFWSKRM